MRGLRFDLLKQQQATDTDFEAVKKKWVSEVAGLCGGEEVLAAGMFRQGGAVAKKVVNRAGFAVGGVGGQLLGRSVTALARKQRAGGLPPRVLLAVTPTKLYAFDYSFQTSRNRQERESGKPVEAAVWDRSALECSANRSGTMTALTIGSPTEDETATLAGGSSADDPWSQDVMKSLGAVAG